MVQAPDNLPGQEGLQMSDVLFRCFASPCHIGQMKQQECAALACTVGCGNYPTMTICNILSV